MADLKINGNTYNGVTEVQIPLADGSANAVFVPEGQGGDGSYEGSFTPEENVESVTLEISGTFTYFLFWCDTTTPTGSVRTCYGAFFNEGSNVFAIGSNSGGTSFNSLTFANAFVTLTDNGDGTWTLKGTANSSGSGVFLAGLKYNWQAWSGPLA